MRTVAAGLALAVALSLAPAAGIGAASSAAAAADTSASAGGVLASERSEQRPGRTVIGRRVIGRSVRGRPITAWRLGERGRRTVVLISTMHGNERQTRAILAALRDGPPIRGIDLWVIPQLNPDGYAANTRQNARGVDLNRNFPYRWAPLGGATYSGPKPASEPETRATMRFLRRVQPSRILSFHQPLYGVNTEHKRPGFAKRVARFLQLPRKPFTCGGTCHGTMTGWYNHHFDGAALTVEYGRRPTRHHMEQRAPRQVLRIFGARRVKR